MKEQKSKVGQFIKEHKTPIIIGGVTIVAIVAYKMRMNSIQQYAYERGGIAGFQATIDWFDETFENVNLRELWETWAEANPEKVITR